jgi:glycosyltransferase involved in cell wall biosynthesis
LRIALIGNEKSVHIVKFARGLWAKGHDLTLFALSAHADGGAQLPADVKRVYLKGRPSLSYFLAAPKLRRLLADGGYDVVNAHYASGYGTLARLAKAKPLVLNVWGSDVYDFPYRSGFKHRLLVKNLLGADVLASTSHAMKEQVLKLLDGYGKEIAIVPFGVDLRRFYHADRSRRQAGGTLPLRVGVVKALKPQYGINYLIEAFAILLEKRPDTPMELRVYGHGEQRGELRALCARLGIEDKVLFGGFMPNETVPDVLSELDIFAAPSLSESFGVAVVEAMASGLPVVATDVDGFREVVADGETGTLVPPRAPEAMAEALLELADNPALRLEMGAKGRKRAEALYDFDKNIDSLLAAFERSI